MVCDMERKKNFVEFLLTDCVSFTALLLILSILNETGMLEARRILECFLCTSAVAGLIALTGLLRIESFLLGVLVNWLDVTVVVALCGRLFRWFPFEGRILLQVFGILTAVFVITAAVIVFQNEVYARRINEKIRKGKDHDTDG